VLDNRISDNCALPLVEKHRRLPQPVLLAFAPTAVGGDLLALPRWRLSMHASSWVAVKPWAVRREGDEPSQWPELQFSHIARSSRRAG
jgi:hypothetical protein